MLWTYLPRCSDFHSACLLLVDFPSYVDCSERAAHAFTDQDGWTKMSILNRARCGFFSSDRSMRPYCEEVWDVKPIRFSESMKR